MFTDTQTSADPIVRSRKRQVEKRIVFYNIIYYLKKNYDYDGMVVGRAAALAWCSQ